MKRKRTTSASPAGGNTPTKPPPPAPQLPSSHTQLVASNTPTRPLPLPETPGKQRRSTILPEQQVNVNGGTESAHSPSPLKKTLRTPMMKRDGVRFADSAGSDGGDDGDNDRDRGSGAVGNADRSARRKSVRRIMSRALVGGDSDDEDEEDVLARRIFGDSESEDGLLADSEVSVGPKKRGRKKKVEKEEEIVAPADGPDSYFFQNRKTRLLTSNRTLSSLPPLDHNSYFRLIREHAPDHVANREYLEELHRANFPQWEFELAQGFNVLLYGYGSKRRLLMDFAKRLHHKTPRSIIVINGYVPTLTIKDALTTVVKAIVGPDHTVKLGSNPNDILDTIFALLDDPNTATATAASFLPDHFTLLVHNLDGESLRTERTQSLISALSAHEKISLVASTDHVRSPLLWDAARISGFNFLWHDATTFAPYAIECSIDDSLALIGGVGGRAGGARGAKFVLASLPTNARALYRVLVAHQLQAIEEGGEGESGEGGSAGGVEYRVLYQKAVEEFICSNDMAFRTLLKEFQDHQMVSSKKDSQGTDVLWAPFKKEELETILEDLVA